MKIINSHGGLLYHYAHFFCDCLYPEVIAEIYKQPKVYRVKSLESTIGTFSALYEEVMGNQTFEVDQAAFDSLPDTLMTVRNLRVDNIRNKKLQDMPVFRDFIFKRYKIDPIVYDPNYPSIVIIKRGSVPLLTDPDLVATTSKRMVAHNGNCRREINDVDQIEEFLKPYEAKSYVLEGQPFKEQIKIFNNAKIIILAHGAAMCNLFFCKRGTTVVEVTCGKNWPYFNIISREFRLNHIRVENNNPSAIIDVLKTVV